MKEEKNYIHPRWDFELEVQHASPLRHGGVTQVNTALLIKVNFFRALDTSFCLKKHWSFRT